MDYVFTRDYAELREKYNFEEKMKPEDVNFVVTHGNCPDGFMSRTIFEAQVKNNPERFNTKHEDMKFINAYHNCDNSNLLEEMRDKNVLICDFSFDEKTFLQMINITKGNIIVLDHHETSKKKLASIPDKYKVFDMKHSGAFLMQVYINGFLNVPKAVLYIEDNDIWTKKLPFTLEFTAYVAMQPFTYEIYSDLLSNIDNDGYLENNIVPIGKGAVMQNQKHIDSILKRTYVAFMKIRDGYYMVPHVNSSGIMVSELGNQAANKFKNSNFAVCYGQDVKYNSTYFSLRSTNEKNNCSVISEYFGGGGHRNASAFSINTLSCYLPGRIIDNHKAYELLENVYDVKYGDEENNKSFLVLNTNVNLTSFVNYLMQPRICEEYNTTYQEGMYVMRNNTGDETLIHVYDGVMCWYKTRTYCNITFKPKNELINKIDTMLKIVSKNVDPKVFTYSVSKGIFYMKCNLRSFEMKNSQTNETVNLKKQKPEKFIKHILCECDCEYEREDT